MRFPGPTVPRKPLESHGFPSDLKGAPDERDHEVKRSLQIPPLGRMDGLVRYTSAAPDVVAQARASHSDERLISGPWEVILVWRKSA